jgi:glyceraldehyde 3-phosphate dehydrogenase
MASIAINGVGRIGRAALKIIEQADGTEVVAVKDLVPPDNLPTCSGTIPCTAAGT